MNEHPIGTRVRVNCPSSLHHGKECVVIGPLKKQTPFDKPPYWFIGQAVDIKSVSIPGDVCAFEPRELIPIYDGNETVSWSSCAWQPKQVRA